MSLLIDRINLLATGIANYLRDSIVPRLLPTGGATGTVLGKSSATNYAVSWITPSAGAGGSAGQIQYNSSGVLTGSTNITVDNNDLLLANNPAPATPTSGIKLFGVSQATSIMLGTINVKGEPKILQPAIFKQNVAMWYPQGNATTVPGVFGFPAPTALGTATARTVATTNLMSRTRRLGYVSSTTAGSFCGHYVTAAQYTVGNGTGLGGFFYSVTFSFSDPAAVSGVRAFVGLSSSVATPTNVEASTLTNSVGLAQLSTDTTQLYIVYGGSSAQTAIALGTNFPPMQSTGVTGGTIYNLILYSAGLDNGVINYRVERVGTTYFTEGTLTPSVVGTQTPASTTLLAHRAWRCNNATALAAGIDVVNIYIETDS